MEKRIKATKKRKLWSQFLLESALAINLMSGRHSSHVMMQYYQIDEEKLNHLMK